MRRFHTNIDKLNKTSDLANAIKDLGYKTLEDILVALGYGKLTARDVSRRVFAAEAPVESTVEEMTQKKGFMQTILNTAVKKSEGRNAVMVSGMGDVLIRFAKCCHPIPGDSIVGFVTRGRGVTVHHSACPKALESDSARRVEVDWTLIPNVKDAKAAAVGPKRSVKVRVFCDDTPGMLASMTQTISAQGVNISQATVRTMKDKKAVCVFEVLVSGGEQLAKVISSLEAKEGIISVERQRS